MANVMRRHSTKHQHLHENDTHKAAMLDFQQPQVDAAPHVSMHARTDSYAQDKLL